MHFFHIMIFTWANSLILSKACEYTSLYICKFVSMGSFRFISPSFPFGFSLALAWYSVLQNLWYLISFAINSIFDIFRSISSSSNQLVYFLIFTSKFFVSACAKFCSFFLTVFLIFHKVCLFKEISLLN